MAGLFGGIAKGLKSAGDLGSISNPSSTLLGIFGRASASGVRVNDADAMRYATVYACVRVIAEDIAKLPVQVWRRKAGGGREPATDHPLHAILRRPNRWMTRYDAFLTMGHWLALRGNAIAPILRNPRGVPVGIVPVPTPRVTLYDTTAGTILYAITRGGQLETAMLDGLPYAIRDEDVVHFRGLAPDGIVGLSPLEQLREAIGVGIAGERHSAAMMKNGARPGGVLKHPGKITAEVAGRLRQSWETMYNGVDNAGKTALLEDGMSWEQLGMTSVDAQFLEQRKLNREEIAGGFRVPLHMIGVYDKALSNNLEHSTRAYYDQTLMPYLEMMEAALDKAFDLPEDVYVEFDVRRLLRADYKTLNEVRRVQTQFGAIMPNEWRDDDGRDPVPAGNVFYRPLNTAYVDPQGVVVAVTPPGGSRTEPLDPVEPEPKPEPGTEA